MNKLQTKAEIVDVYIKRLVEQNKQEYSDAYDLGKKSIYVTLAKKDATIYSLEEIIQSNKLNAQTQAEQKNVIMLNTTFNANWSWVSKIIYALALNGAPMCSQQMIAYFVTVDQRMRTSHDRVGYFSAFLTKAIKNGRVVKIKIKGFKGNFYSLPEWMVDGQLPPTFYRKMNLFVHQ